MKRLTMTHNLLTQKCTAMLSMLLLLLFAVVPQVAQAEAAMASTLSGGVKTSNASTQTDEASSTDERLQAFTLDGVTVKIEDSAEYPWVYDATNCGIVSGNKDVSDSESTIKITFSADKDYYIAFDYGVLNYNADEKGSYSDENITLLIDGESYHVFSTSKGVTKSFGYLFTSGSQHVVEMTYKRPLFSMGTICAFLKKIVATTGIADKKTTTTLYASLDSEDNCVMSYGQIKLPCSNLDEAKSISSNLQRKNLKISESLKTYFPTSLYGLLGKCNPISISDLENLNTSHLTDLSGMFANCYSLQSLDLSPLNTDNVTNMSEMFQLCYSLEYLDISPLNTSKVIDMSRMFNCCFALKSINLSSLNTTSAENMSGLFRQCENLEGLDLSMFNTEKVTNFFDVFDNCRKLTSLDMTSFDTRKVQVYNWMFSGCSNLKTIYVSDKFVINSSAESYSMFESCKNLTGATSFDASKYDATMANYQTGYFKTYYQVGDVKRELCGEELKVDNLVLEDGKDFKAAAPFTATNVTYTREVKSATNGRLRGTISRWGSICLPYAITAPANCQLFTLSGVQMDNTTNEGTIIMEEVDQLEAGTPAFYCVKDASVTSVNFNASDATIVNTLVDNSANAVDGVYLKGTYTTQSIDEGYVLMNNSMWNAATIKAQNSGKTVNSKGLRAYLALAPNATAAAQKLNFDTKPTTGIESVINVMNDADAEIYDASGRRQGSLQHGLNIIRQANGKSVKVMVK